MQTTDLGHARGWLTHPAAASIARIDRALGHPMQVSEAGRSWRRQDEHYQAYLRYLAGGPWAPIALSPDAPSVHQLGNAIDSDEAQQHVALMAEHGWIRTVYRNGKLVEPWHFEYSASRDQHLNDPDPITLLGDPMSLRIIDGPFYRAAGYRVIHNGHAATSVPAGWVQEMITKGGVDYASYDDDNLLQTEVNLVWQLGGLSTSEAAAKTTTMLKAISES